MHSLSAADFSDISIQTHYARQMGIITREDPQVEFDQDTVEVMKNFRKWLYDMMSIV